jgi:hypothetical protein
MSGTHERVLLGEDLVAWRRFRVAWPESLPEPGLSNARKAFFWDTPPTDLFKKWKALLEAQVRDTIDQATTAEAKKKVETMIASFHREIPVKRFPEDLPQDFRETHHLLSCLFLANFHQTEDDALGDFVFKRQLWRSNEAGGILKATAEWRISFDLVARARKPSSMTAPDSKSGRQIEGMSNDFDSGGDLCSVGSRNPASLSVHDAEVMTDVSERETSTSDPRDHSDPSDTEVCRCEANRRGR